MLPNKSSRTLRLPLMVLLILIALWVGIGSMKTAQAAPDANKTLTIITSETKISKTGGLGITTTTITLKLSGAVSPPSDTIVTVTPSGTAFSGVDYTTTPADSSSITIPLSSTQASFDVTTTASSGNQKLTLTITCNACSGVTVGTTASVDIILWDENTSVSLSQPTYSVLPKNGSIDVTASISQTWPEDTVVNLGYTGTASKIIAPLDFSGPNFVTIPKGQLSASFTLNALGTYNGNSKTLNVAITSVPTNVSFDSTAVNLTMEAPGFSIDTGGLDPLPIPESGDTIFAIHLKTKPTKDITVAISSSDTSVSTATTSSLTFTTANWSTPQTVTITGKSDSQCLFTSYSIHLNPSSTNPSPDPNYNSFLNTTVAANNNEYCVSIATPTYPYIRPGGTLDLTVSIAHAVTQNVTATLLFSGGATKDTHYTTSATSVTFTQGGLTSKTITLTATGFTSAMADKTITATLANITTPVGNIDSTQNSTTVTLSAPELILSATPPLIVSEAGNATFTARLRMPPTNTVTVAISSGDTSVSTATTTSLSFTSGVAGNWNSPQTVTITGKSDSQCLYKAYNITLNPASLDTGYNALSDSIVSANNNEYCVSITAPTNAYMAPGETVDLTVSITPTLSQATTVNLTYSGATKGSDFTAPNSVTILANQSSATLTLTAAAGFTLASPDKTVQVNINSVSAPATLDASKPFATATLSVPEVQTDVTSTLLVKETGLASVSFHVRLRMPPATSDVTITPTLSSSSVATITAPSNGGSLTFTTNNWNTYQTITIKAKTDSVCSLLFYNVNLFIFSTDARYPNGFTPNPVEATNAEYCAALSPTSGTIYGAGKTISMTVSIAQKFPQDVTVGLTFGGDAVKGTDYDTPPTSLTILTGNLSASFNLTAKPGYNGDPKTITVTISGTAANDVDPSQKTASISMTDAKFILTPDSGTLLVRENPAASVPVQLKLKSKPSSSVTITITSGKPTISTITPTNILTFTTSDWDQNKTFYVQGVDDGSCVLYFYNVNLVASSSDTNYDTIQVAVPATNAEYCAAISPSSDTLYGPNQTTHLTVSIAQIVTEDVLVSLNFGDSATLGTDYTVTEPSMLTIPVGSTSASFDLSTTPGFNAENKTVTVQISSATVGTVDLTKDTSTISLSTPALVVDTNGVSVLQVYEHPNLATVPIKIKLNTQPKNGNVTVDLSTTNSTVSQLSKTQLTFTKDNWNIDQTVNVQAKNDGQCKLIKYQITLNSSSPDSKFNNLHKVLAATNADYCAFLPALAKDTVLYADTFNNANAWSMQSEAGAKAVQTGSEMVITHISPVRNVRVLAPNTIPSLSSGFSAVVSAKKVGVDGAEYGMIFDYVAPTALTPSYYRFLINPITQSYRLEKIVCTNTCVKTSVSSGISTAILTGNNTNILRVDWTGTTMKLYINGNLINTVTTDAYSDGRLGLMMYTVADTSAAQPSEVHFSNYFVVKK